MDKDKDISSEIYSNIAESPDRMQCPKCGGINSHIRRVYTLVPEDHAGKVGEFDPTLSAYIKGTTPFKHNAIVIDMECEASSDHYFRLIVQESKGEIFLAVQSVGGNID